MFSDSCIVIDNGTEYFKAGFSSDDEPKLLFPPNKRRCIIDYNWQEMTEMWDYIFEKLDVNPKNCSVLLTEPLNIFNNEIEMSQIMFETFQVERLFIVNKSAVTLLNEGKDTGIFCDSGYSISHFVPVLERYIIPKSISLMELGGRDVTDYLIKLLCDASVYLSTTSNNKIADIIKKDVCYVPIYSNNEVNNFKVIPYELPDGNVIKLNDKILQAPEIIFHPELINKATVGFSQQCFNSIKTIDDDYYQKELYQNIVLSGGNSLFKGMAKRLEKEIIELAPGKMKKHVRVVIPKTKYPSWMGSKIMVSCSSFEPFWITNDEWYESREKILTKKLYKSPSCQNQNLTRLLSTL